MSDTSDCFHESTGDPETRCRLLRTKMMFVTNEWEARASEYPSSTASYWCLKTMGPVGPDDAPADLESCQQGRGCFRRGA